MTQKIQSFDAIFEEEENRLAAHALQVMAAEEACPKFKAKKLAQIASKALELDSWDCEDLDDEDLDA